MPKSSAPLSPLDVLLLVFLQSGLATPYDLLKEVGIGVGTSIPALRRLEEQGILIVTAGPRDRMQFSITREGKAQLKKAIEDGSERYWRHGGRDTFDNLRRAVFLNWATASSAEAERCFSQASQDLLDLAGKRMQEADRFKKLIRRRLDEAKERGNSVDPRVLLPTVYRWISAEMDARLFEAQVGALESLGGLVDSLPAAPKA